MVCPLNALNNRSQTNDFCYQLLDGFHQTKPHLSAMKCTFSRFVNVVGQLFVKVTTPTVQRNAHTRILHDCIHADFDAALGKST